jgi:hypothetical protein
MERVYLEMFVQGLDQQEDVLTDYRASEGLCLHHFRRAVTVAHDQTTLATLVDVQQTRWQALVDQLSEAIRKSDWRFRDEPQGDEMKAWLRAIAVLAGS